MKTTNVNGHVHKKWSTRECDDNSGWKLKDVRRKQVKAESLDGVEIIRELFTTNFDDKFHDRYWRVGDIHLVENDKLKSQFEEYKKELIELGRPPDTIKETLAFSAESEKSCKDICQEGYKVGSKKRHILGHTGSGVHLVRHYDILTRYLMFQQYTSPAYIIVYKTFLGKTKPIVPRLHKDDNYVPPYMGFDSHVSARHLDKEMPICEALNCSYVYLYEFDQTASNPVKHPRQILPYVIIQLEKKVPCVPENPFLAVGNDETRSTWEVKGETRRGFRFMFTKSGLKGKHKDFSKGCNKANIGSYLKGQILEMRTKYAGSVSEAKPPLLQKIDESCINMNTEEIDTSKPPDLQKCASSSQQSSAKNEKFIFSKEIENLVIPTALLEIRQLSNLKPYVKLKRLDPVYLKGPRFRIKNGNEIDPNGRDTEKTKSNSEAKRISDSKLSSSDEDKQNSKSSLQNSETERIMYSDCENDITHSSGGSSSKLKTKKSKTHEESKIKETHTDDVLKMNSEPRRSRRSTEKTLAFIPSDMYKVETETLAPKEKRAADIPLSKKVEIHDIENQIRVRTADRILVKFKKSTNSAEYKTKLLTTKDKTVDVCLKKDSFCKPACLSEKEDKSTSNNSVNDIKTNSCTPVQKCIIAKTHSGDEPACIKESRSSSKLTDTIYKTDKRKREICENVDLVKKKKEYSNLTRSAKLNDLTGNTAVGKTFTSEQKPAFDQSLRRNKRKSRVVKLNDSRLKYVKEKAKRSKLDEDKTTSAHRKENQTEMCTKKEKSKHMSSRCHSTKTKFGMIAYTINKNKGRSGRNISENVSKSSEKGKTDTPTKYKEYDFHIPNEEQNSLTFKVATEKQACSENGAKVHKSSENVNELTVSNLSDATVQNEVDNTDKQSNTISEARNLCAEKPTEASDDNPARKANTTVPDINFKKQSQNQTQRMVLEKSKSPVVANAAPDMLNISPVLVSAQTSTSSLSDSKIAIQNAPVNVGNPLENQKQTGVYPGTDLTNKSNIFFSEMSTFYGNSDKIQTIGLIKQFPEPFTRTHVVHPVLRATLNAEIKLPTRAETKIPYKRKKASEKTQTKLGSDTNTEQTELDTSAQRIETATGVEDKGKRTNFTPDGNTSKSATTVLSNPCKKTHTELIDKQNYSNKSNDKVSDVRTSHNLSVTPLIQHNETPVSSIHSAQNKELSLSSASGNKADGMTEAQPNLRSKQSSKCRRSKPTGKDENKNAKKNTDMTVLSLNSSVITKNDSNITMLKSDLLQATCSDQNNFANSDSNNGNKIVTDRQQNSNESLEHKVSKKKREVKTSRKEDDNAKRNEIDTRISSAKHKNTTSKFIKGPTHNFVDTKNAKQQQHLEISENSNIVKVDTFTADRLRSFLSSTAAVAIQHRKSVDQKSDTEVEDISPDKQNKGLESPDQKYDAKSNLSVNQKRDTEPENRPNSTIEKQFHKSPKPYHEAKTNECNNSGDAETSNKTCQSFSKEPKDKPFSSSLRSLDSSSKTKSTDIISKEHLKEPKVMPVKQSIRRDSCEMHDSDSQDTVIGGVTDSPLRHITSVSTSQEHLMSFGTLFAKSKHSNIQPSFAFCIKQEQIEDSYHEQPLPHDKAKCAHSNSERHPPFHKEPVPNTVILNPVNQLSSNTLQADKGQSEIMSNKEIKQEPEDHMSDATCVTSSVHLGTQSVKTEPCSPTCIFPQTRRELAKGAEMLNTTECRSAIVDTLRELSSVLKFLTDNNTQSPKQTEKVALVAKKMCSVLSGESTTKASKADESILTKTLAKKDKHGHSLLLKSEPIDTDYTKSMDSLSQINLQNSNLTTEDSFCRSEREENYCFNEYPPSSDPEFQYEYILKPSEDEYQSAYESVAMDSRLKDTIDNLPHNEPVPTDCFSSKEYETQIDSLHQFFGPTAEKAGELTNQHGIDELPRLFDPNEEPDISYLEQFGISKEPRRQNSEDPKHTEHLSLEMSAADKTNKVPPANVMKEIKTEKGTECMTVKSKAKQTFNLKTGVLNKGLKERKNMFDLKINGSRRKTVVNMKPFDNQFPVMPKTPITEMPEKTVQTDLAKVENPSYLKYHEETDCIMNDVYKTVCEKLSTLKESFVLENDGNFSPEHSKPTSDAVKKIECESSSNSDTLVPSKDKQTQAKPDINKKERDLSIAKCTSPKEEVKKSNIKKHAVIPFHTVIKLKKHQFWRYKRGETNKKFIDYKELFAKMSSRRQVKSYGKKSDTHKQQNMHNMQTSKASISKANENLGKQLNYFIPSFKTSEISERGTALIEDNTSKALLPETTHLKRNSSDADERHNFKRIKISSDKTERREADSHRSRSRSSPRSSASRHRSAEHSQSSEKHKSSSESRKYGHYSVRDTHPYKKFGHHVKPFHTTRTQFNGRGSYRAYPTRFHQNNRFAGRPSFNKSGTGYFSWRRKYQPQKNIFDSFVVTDKGSVQSMSEYAEWSRFKERETIRVQIENAIKEYRRTFEDTPDDLKGDKKVASYLTFLTEKLDKIQTKRDKLNIVETNEDRNSKHRRSTSSEKLPAISTHQPRKENKSHLFRKLEKSHSFHQHETQQHSSLSRFSGSLASDSDSLSYKQRRHASGIEELLKEHITKHCEHLTKQIKQEMEDMKTAKTSSPEKEHKVSTYPGDLHRKRYDLKMKYNDDKYRRHSRERYDSNRMSKGEASTSGGGYSQSYHGSREKSYDRKYYNPKDKYDKGKHSYDRIGRDDKRDNRYTYGDKYERRQHSFRKQHNSNYGPSYNKDYHSKSKYFRKYDAGNFDDSKYVGKSSRNDADRSHERNHDYRKTYDYQQNFDKYQEKIQEKHSAHDSDIRKRLDLRNKSHHSRAYQPKHWFRGKYNKYFNKGTTDSKINSEGRNENNKLETGSDTVQDEFDATQYRQFTPTFRGYNKRGRGFFRGINRFPPAYKQHYQPAKFSSIRNPATYFFYGDESTDKVKKNGDKTPDSGEPKKDGTSVEVTLGKDAACSNQTPTSVKSDQPKPIPIMCGIRQTTKKENM